MGDKNNLKGIIKNAMPFIAIGIFAMLIISIMLLSKEQKLKEEISQNCGWGEANYY